MNKSQKEAIHWFMCKQKSNHSIALQNEFSEWLLRDVENQQVYEQVCQFVNNNQVETLTEDLPWPSLDELETDGLSDKLVANMEQELVAENVPENESAQLFFQFNNWFSKISLFPASIATLVLVIITSILWATVFYNPSSYLTKTGEQKSITLPDGTQVILSSESKLELMFEEGKRHAKLISGRAVFEVVSDAARPFTIDFGTGVVKVVGTAFDIRKINEASEITVLHGVVEVKPYSGNQVELASIVLTHGDQIHVDKQLGQVRQVDLEKITSWRNGILQFIDEPLSTVFSDINRYLEHDVVIQDELLAEQNFSGTVNVKQIDAWLGGLKQAYNLNTVKLSNETVLLSRKEINLQ